MKISYDVQCPQQENAECCNKYEKQYEKMIHFVHSNKKTLLIEMDNPINFVRNFMKTYQYIYPKFSTHIENRKLWVHKTW
jgi:hypothetical protein